MSEGRRSPKSSGWCARHVDGLGRTRSFNLVCTDPPYSFGNQGVAEHELSADVAVILREAGKLVRPGGWILVLSASSERSMGYVRAALRGVLIPIRTVVWCKPTVQTKVRTAGWRWDTVAVTAFRNGKSTQSAPSIDMPGYIIAEPVRNGRRAELLPTVCDCLVALFITGGVRTA